MLLLPNLSEMQSSLWLQRLGWVVIWTSFWTVTSLPFAFATPDAKQDHRLQNFLATTSNRNDWTRLMLAIIEGVEAVKQVLEGGVDINIRGVEPFQGMTPLAFASRIGSLETVRLLVERGGG
jgi:ankyrin repeat protein